MIIGQKSEFAIEYEIYASQCVLKLCHFCLWSKNRQIGNFEDVVALRGVIGCIESTLEYSGTRYEPERQATDKTNLFWFLKEALYGEPSDDPAQRFQSPKYQRFNLKDVGDSAFDGVFVFLIDSFSGQRLLWGEGSDACEVFESKYDPLIVDQCFKEFLNVQKVEPNIPSLNDPDVI